MVGDSSNAASRPVPSLNELRLGFVAWSPVRSLCDRCGCSHLCLLLSRPPPRAATGRGRHVAVKLARRPRRFGHCVMSELNLVCSSGQRVLRCRRAGQSAVRRLLDRRGDVAVLDHLRPRLRALDRGLQRSQVRELLVQRRVVVQRGPGRRLRRLLDVRLLPVLAGHELDEVRRGRLVLGELARSRSCDHPGWTRPGRPGPAAARPPNLPATFDEPSVLPRPARTRTASCGGRAGCPPGTPGGPPLPCR